MDKAISEEKLTHKGVKILGRRRPVENKSFKSVNTHGKQRHNVAENKYLE